MADVVPLARSTAQREAERQVLLADLREIRYSPAIDRQRGAVFGLRTLSIESGVSSWTIYHFINTGIINWRPQMKLAAALSRLREEYGYQAPRPQPPARAPEQPKTSEPITKYLRFR